MKAEIEVLQPGLFSTIQYPGRFGYLKYGVPMSGPMDSYSFRLANLLLNNPPASSAMEITQMGPVLRFLSAGYLVITGANLSPQINKIEIRNGMPYVFAPGDVLSFGTRKSGCRSYLAMAGGFKTEKVLGSDSWYEDITDFYRLKKGMKLEINESFVIPAGNASIKVDAHFFSDSTIPVFAGPEFNKLTEKQVLGIFSRSFRIDKNNNRMAIQLEEVIPNEIKPIITGPVVPGTVQLTPSGKLIVLMRDCQTTGGYPRILQLSENGINRIAQKVQGDPVEFKLLS